MACKCTQTTSNATGGGAITSALSACTYPLWINHVSGCTGSALDVHVGNPNANILFNIGQATQNRTYDVDNIGINKQNPLHTLSLSGTVDVENFMHFDDVGYGSKLTTSGTDPGSNSSVYLGFGAGKTRTNNANSAYNVGIGAQSLGSNGVLNAASLNVGIGYGSLYNLTSGQNNVVLGFASGQALTSGKQNTLLGSSAGPSLTTQDGNVFIGYGQGSQSTESNTLRIGNKPQVAGGASRPLILGDFSTSAATINGNLRITDTPAQLNIGLLGVDPDGYIKETKAILKQQLVPLSYANTGVWTANTIDAAGEPFGNIGYRSVSISGGTNPNDDGTTYYSTRVGIGTDKPEVPLHIKGKYSYFYTQSVGGGASYIASITDSTIAYLGAGAGGGVKSGATTWRFQATTSDQSMPYPDGVGRFVGTGFSLSVFSREVAGDPATQTVRKPFAVLGDINEIGGSALVIRGDAAGIGPGGVTKGIGIFTPTPNKEVTIVGGLSATGAIHSTNYLKFPDQLVKSTYIGYAAGSGGTTDIENTAVGYQALQDLNGSGAYENTAVGYLAGASIRGNSDFRNTFMGAEAGAMAGTGSDASSNSFDNTFVGSHSFRNNSQGYSNTGLGRWAMYWFNTNQSGNVAVGDRAMMATRSGAHNVSVGKDSGGGALCQHWGHSNISIGSYVGNNSVNGDNSGRVFIGHGIGTAATQVNDVIAIGYNAQPRNYEFMMNIGNSIYGMDRYGAGARKNIGINKISAHTALDVVHDQIPSIGENTGGGYDIVTFGDAGVGFEKGYLVQLRGAANWVKADADHTSLQGNLLGIALGNEVVDGILLKGYFKINAADDVAAFSAGQQLYVSTTEGKITDSLASHSTGDYVRVVGNMTSTENVIYFNPDNTFVVI